MGKSQDEFCAAFRQAFHARFGDAVWIGGQLSANMIAAEVICQASFLDDHWYGRADFLIRIDRPSNLGSFSYEVVEAKLARTTKARAIIQLCFYSDLLSQIQGLVPKFMHVVLGGRAAPEKFLVSHYLAYFRKIRRDFEAGYAANAATYPEPVESAIGSLFVTSAGMMTIIFL
jgi:uncharacterized protein